MRQCKDRDKDKSKTEEMMRSLMATIAVGLIAGAARLDSDWQEAMLQFAGVMYAWTLVARAMKNMIMQAYDHMITMKIGAIGGGLRFRRSCWKIPVGPDLVQWLRSFEVTCRSHVSIVVERRLRVQRRRSEQRRRTVAN